MADHQVQVTIFVEVSATANLPVARRLDDVGERSPAPSLRNNTRFGD